MALELHITRGLRHITVDIGLTVAPGETVALVGPSGAGKTTVLRAVAGLMAPDGGHIACGGVRWFGDGVDLPPERRSVGYVPQDGALFPHLSVARNVAFAGVPDARVRELLGLLGIAHLADARPDAISGGERRRAALARALARRPQVLLLDEPLAGLDALTVERVRGALKEALRQARVPTLLVTHDVVDVAALDARLAIMLEGRIVQEGSVAEVSAAPGGEFAQALVARRLPAVAADE